MGWLNIRKKLKLLFSVKTLTFYLFLKHVSLTRAIFRNTLYYIFHPDGQSHGGTALFITNDIKHYQIGKYQRKCL